MIEEGGAVAQLLQQDAIRAHVKRAFEQLLGADLGDRLVKAMRLEGISSIEDANAFLDSYRTRHAERFARPAFDARDLHRPLAPHDDLRSIMFWREQRTVTAALTLHYNKAMFILERTMSAWIWRASG